MPALEPDPRLELVASLLPAGDSGDDAPAHIAEELHTRGAPYVDVLGFFVDTSTAVEARARGRTRREAGKALGVDGGGGRVAVVGDAWRVGGRARVKVDVGQRGRERAARRADPAPASDDRVRRRARLGGGGEAGRVVPLGAAHLFALQEAGVERTGRVGGGG